jgi:transposase
MQGRHAFEPKSRKTIDLESFVASDHYLRQVDRVLELSFVGELTAACYSRGKGRPSIDPEIYFRMLLVSYIYGITSDRRLCEEVRYNLAYRWFCRLSLEDDVPDHSSLSRIRDRLGEQIFEKVFRQIVDLCKQKGLVSEQCRVMTDATLIPADASLNSLVHNDPKEAKKEAKAQSRDRGMIGSSQQRRVTNQTHSSRTDPEATLAQKKGTPRQLKYKVHQSIDADSRVILDTEVTTGARHDNQPYLAQLGRIVEKYKIQIAEAIADRGYGSAAIIGTLQEQGTTTYLPLWSGRVGNSKYLKGEMVYEKEHDRLRCLAGKYLTPTPSVDKNYKRYVIDATNCTDCPHTAACSARAKKQSRKRLVMRNMDQDLFEEVQAHMRDPTFRQRMSERMWKIEGLFAEAKQNHGLARARYRGRSKVQIQAYMSAMVLNLKRLVALFYCWLLWHFQSPRKSTA